VLGGAQPTVSMSLDGNPPVTGPLQPQVLMGEPHLCRGLPEVGVSSTDWNVHVDNVIVTLK